MKRLDIFFLNKLGDTTISTNIIKIHTKKNNYELMNEINKIDNFIKMQDMIKRINIIFDKSIEQNNINSIISKLHNILYPNYKKIKEIKLYKVENETNILMKCLDNYKDIVMHPNKTPDNYLKWILSNIPKNYVSKVKKTSTTFFPLTHAVSIGSEKSAYFVHIYPKKINPKNKNVYLIGKAVTYDSGGLNIKDESMCEMKTDMTGSAILIAVLKLLPSNINHNIHILIPIVENMIGPNSIKPGSVIKSMSGITVEIENTDAEGRLCMADCLDYIKLKLINKKNNNLIIDIATLTGATIRITDGVATVAMCNSDGDKYLKKMIEIGEICGEYVESLKLRNEYMDILSSNVADIKNCKRRWRRIYSTQQ